MAYRSIETNIWQDSKLKMLDIYSKLVFVYLITNNHTHYCGLYYLPLQLIEFELNVSNKDIKSSINKLISLELIKYDNENNIIWVINMTKYQCKSSQSKLIAGIKNYLTGVKSPLVDEFECYYNEKLYIL